MTSPLATAEPAAHAYPYPRRGSRTTAHLRPLPQPPYRQSSRCRRRSPRPPPGAALWRSGPGCSQPRSARGITTEARISPRRSGGIAGGRPPRARRGCAERPASPRDHRAAAAHRPTRRHRRRQAAGVPWAALLLRRRVTVSASACGRGHAHIARQPGQGLRHANEVVAAIVAGPQDDLRLAGRQQAERVYNVRRGSCGLSLLIAAAAEYPCPALRDRT
jgi:hypothetical protein